MRIPLFPLHAVLAPGIALPLHIFEERYRVMVRHCLDTSSPFGVVLIRAGAEVAPRRGAPRELAIAGIGTFAEIRGATKYADGRFDLLAVGGGRFVVRDVQLDREPYLVAEVDTLDDEVGNPAVADALVQRVIRRFVDYLRLLQPRDGEVVEPIDVQVEVEVPEREEDEAIEADATDEDDDDDADAADGDEDDADEDADADADAGGGSRGAPAGGAHGGGPEALAAALRIPDDPSALSFLLTGIVQVELERKQALLEAGSAEERLRDLDDLLDRELLLLRRRLAPFTPDRAVIATRVN